MRVRLNPAWKYRIIDDLEQYKRSNGRNHVVRTESMTSAIQWMVMRLVADGIPFRLINLGAGVKQITTDTTVCPKCHGTGKV